LPQQTNNANAGPANRAQVVQADGTQMNGATLANGFTQQANGAQVNGVQAPQPNGAAPPQNRQPAQPTARQMQAIILNGAKEIARQQGRMDVDEQVLAAADGAY